MKIDFISDINRENYQALNYDKVDRFMLRALWWHFAILSLYSLALAHFKPSDIYPSPYSWSVISFSEALSAIAVGFAAALSMTLLRGRLVNHYVYRLLMSAALLTYSALLVFVTGGSIEAHFHFFIVFALLTLYRDWRLGWWGVAAVALHHGILNYVHPHWVYYYGRNDIAFTAHAVMVLVMAAFTTRICENGRNDVEAIKNANIGLEGKIKDRTKELESAKTALEGKVAGRTKELLRVKASLETEVRKRTNELEASKKELQGRVAELERINRLSVGRELKMAELKKKISELERGEK